MHNRERHHVWTNAHTEERSVHCCEVRHTELRHARHNKHAASCERRVMTAKRGRRPDVTCTASTAATASGAVAAIGRSNRHRATALQTQTPQRLITALHQQHRWGTKTTPTEKPVCLWWSAKRSRIDDISISGWGQVKVIQTLSSQPRFSRPSTGTRPPRKQTTLFKLSVDLNRIIWVPRVRH